MVKNLNRLLVALLLVLPAQAATKIYLHNTASTIAGYKNMDLSLGPFGIGAGSVSTTTTTASGTKIQLTDTAGGTALAWISEPFSGSVTLSGTDTMNLYGGESANSVNAKYRFELYKYSGGSEGAVFCSGDMGSELTTSTTTARNWTGTPTSTAFSAGDRLVVKVFAINSGTMGAGTVTSHYEGDTDASDGSSWIQINESATFDPNGGVGGTPTIVQWMASPDMANTGQQIAANGHIKFCLPNMTLSGNCLIMFMRAIPSVTLPALTITDDGGNTWNMANKTVDGAKVGYVYYAPNIAANTRQVDVQFSTLTVSFSVALFEVANIATSSPVDAGSGTGGGAGSAPGAITAGSFTPKMSGDMLFQYTWDGVVSDNSTNYTVGTAGSPNITWNLGAVSLEDAYCVTYGTYSSTAAINPSTTVSETHIERTTEGGANASHLNSQAVAFKSSTSGTLATASPRIFGIMCSTDLVGSTTNKYMAIPTTGNLLVVGIWAGFEDFTNVPTDTLSATYYAAGAKASQGGVVSARWYYKTNATPSNTLKLNYTLDSVGSDANVALIDIIGGGAYAGGGDYVTATGNQTGVGPTTLGALTPSTASGLAFVIHSVDFNTVTNIDSGWLLQNGFLGLNNSANTPFYENNGFASKIITSTSTTTPAVSYMSGLGANVANWASAEVFFPAPTTSSGVMRPSMTRVIIGQ